MINIKDRIVAWLPAVVTFFSYILLIFISIDISFCLAPMFLEGNIFIEIELGEYLKKIMIFGGIQVICLSAIQVHLKRTPKKIHPSYV